MNGIEMKRKSKWETSYVCLKSRCNNPNATGYKRYGGRGIKCLISKKEVQKLWFRDKAYLMKRPSIDRIDNDGNYTYDNCQFIELGENSRKANKNKGKKILQYDLDGNFIKEWSCARKIERELNFRHQSISQCCLKKKKTSRGFIWIYKNSQKVLKKLSNKELNFYLSNANSIPVCQYNKNNKFIKEWENAKKAGKQLKVDATSINKVCRGKLKSAGDFIWKYKND